MWWLVCGFAVSTRFLPLKVGRGFIIVSMAGVYCCIFEFEIEMILGVSYSFVISILKYSF